MVSLDDLAEFREGVEGIVASLAVERAKGEDIKHLRKLLKKAKIHLRNGVSEWDAFMEVDNQIHMALANIARNPIYVAILQTIYDNIRRYWGRFLPIEEFILKETYRDLCEVVRAVEKRQSYKASLVIQNHVYRFNRLMEERAQQKANAKTKDESNR